MNKVECSPITGICARLTAAYPSLGFQMDYETYF